MLIECASDKPLRLVGPWTDSALVLRPGEPVHVVPELGQRILLKCEGKVQLADDSPFHIGQMVTYRVPVNIKSPTVYFWEEHTGIIERIDEANELALIIPSDEAYVWPWVAMTFVKAEGRE